MERYSTLWGTDKAGVYGRQGTSKRLGNFLTQKIGGSNVKDVVDITEKILTGFKSLPGYELENLDNKPLAVVYSPMYLKNKPGMPQNMKGFCTLSVNGMENRAGRKESNYAHTIFFAQHDMLNGGEYNYLDLLMGTYQLTCRDVKGHRDGTSRINFEQAPNKVSPVMRNQDMPVILKTIECIYKGKNVIITLEEGVSFNRRAMELLTQIYSMMQPALAAETGFATYQTVDRIQELSAETNVQIYVVPAGVDLSKLRESKFEILDLASNRIVPEQTPLAMMLLEWRKIEWPYRQSAMEHLFAKDSDYLNAEEFVNMSGAFFDQMKDLNTWLTDTSKHGTIDTLEALKAEDKTQSGWKLIPWARKSFESKVPALLKKGVSVESMTATSLAEAYEYDGVDENLKRLSVPSGVDAALRQKAVSQYKYGRNLAGVSEAVLSQKIWEKANACLSPAYITQIKLRDDKIQSDAAKHKQIVDKLNADYAANIDILNANHADALKAADEAKAAAIAAEAAKTAEVQQKLNTANQVHAAAIAKLNDEHAAVVVKLNDEHTAAMTAKDNAHNEAVTKLNADHAVALASLETAKAAAVAAEHQKCEAAVAVQKAETNRIGSLLEKARGELETKKREFDEQTEELAKAKSAATRRKQKITEQETELERLNKLLVTRGVDPTPPEPVIPILGVKVPKSVTKVIALAAAVAFLVGVILSSVIVGLVAGGKGEPVETIPPTITVPTEPATTPTTEPTVPETTVPPTEPVLNALLDDGSVDWGYIRENVHWVDAVVTDPDAIAGMLAGQEVLLDGWRMEAILTPAEWALGDEENVTPAFITVLTNSTAVVPNGENPLHEENDSHLETPVGGDLDPEISASEEDSPVDDETAAEEETFAVTMDISLKDLGDWAKLAIMVNGRCVVVHFNYGEDAALERSNVTKAAVEIAALIAAENAELRFFSYALEDGRMINLTDIMTVSDWHMVCNISFDEQDFADMKLRLGTSRKPVSIINTVHDICVYDYADDPERALKLAKLMTDKGHIATVSGEFVLVLINAEVLNSNT